MTDLIAFVDSHGLACLVGYWVVSAAISAMPEPNGNKFYRWLYGFAHGLAMNLDKVKAAMAKKQETK